MKHFKILKIQTLLTEVDEDLKRFILGFSRTFRKFYFFGPFLKSTNLEHKKKSHENFQGRNPGLYFRKKSLRLTWLVKRPIELMVSFSP